MKTIGMCQDAVVPERASLVRSRGFIVSTLATVLFATTAVGAGCSLPATSPGGNSAANSNGVGAVRVALDLGSGTTLDSATYTLSSAAGTVVQTSSIDLTNTESIDFQIADVPPGSGYEIAVTATGEGGVACSGSAGPFSVISRAITRVQINMSCYSSGADAGIVYVSGVPYLCATWNSLATVDPAHPGTTGSEANVGSSVTLLATATGPDPQALTYTWTSSDPIGTFGTDQPNGTSDTITFLCTAPGTTTITLTVGDGPVPEGGACDPAQSTITALVTCDSPPATFDRVDFTVTTGTQMLAVGASAAATLQLTDGSSQRFVIKALQAPAWKADTTHTASFRLDPPLRACDVAGTTVQFTGPAATDVSVVGVPLGTTWTVDNLTVTLSIDESDQTTIVNASGNPLATLTAQNPLVQETASCETGPSLFARLGGETPATSVANDFINRVTGDERLSRLVGAVLSSPAAIDSAKAWSVAEMCRLGGGGCTLTTASPFAGAITSTGELIALVNDLTTSMAKFPAPATLADVNQLLGSPLVPPPDPAPGVVGNEVSSPIYYNLYWDASWDADNSLPREALDSFGQAVTGSTYYSGLSQYGIGAPTFLGSTLPGSGCTQTAPSSVGFYDPVNASIIGFLQCELDNDSSVPQGNDVIYNIVLPQFSVERDAIAQLLGVPADCAGGAVSWHFHGTPYSLGAVLGGLLGGLVGASVGDPVTGAIAGFLFALSQQGGPLYTIESTSSTCGNFTSNLMHEMVEAASDPEPPISVITSGGNGEIDDNCSNSTGTTPFVPVDSALSPNGFLSISAPQYQLNSTLSCSIGFNDTTVPTISGVSMSGSFPEATITISGSGFGSLPGSFSLPSGGLLPYLGFQDTDEGWQAGNSLNADPVLMTVTSWSDTSVTINGFSPPNGTIGMAVGDNVEVWACNPASGNCSSTHATSTIAGGGLNPNDIVSVSVTIETGSDNARSDSEIQITIDGATMCLKPSNNASGDAICNNGGSSSDQNGLQSYDSPSNDGTQTFPSSASDMGPGVGTFNPTTHLVSMQIKLISHDSSFLGVPTETDDNWNIQGIQVVGNLRGGGTTPLLNIAPSGDSSACVARLKGTPNATTVSFTLDGTNGHTYVDGTSSEMGEVTSCSNNGG
jgi:hypothetical protein